MADPALVISLAAEFVGKPAFKQADTATQKLSKNVSKLAKSFGLAFGTTAILAYGKASLKAAAADEKAQKQLALALKNVGLGRDAASSEEYIQGLQSEFGIVDDLLRPAYQTLAVATRDSEQAQKLFNLSLDISASTGRDLGSVTGALSKAFLGNNTALSKLGVGISKADLKAGKFEDILDKLTTTFAGSATAAANTFQGSIDKLGVASANVQEIIGTGLIDALTNLGKDTSISDLASNMEKTATYLADVIRGIGVLSSKLKDIPVLGNLNVGMIPIVGSYIELLRKAGIKTAELSAADNTHLKSLNQQFKVIKKTGDITTKLTKDELAKLKAKQLQLAIDKGNLALAKGADVFDLDKIQNAAALANQAEQLGKATSAAQLMQIANDTARLNVKKSISDLEDAIASKDEAAITAATKKLNADLGILGALTSQKTQLLAIETILTSLMPKDLINLANLNAALALLQAMASIKITPIAAAQAVATSSNKSNAATIQALSSSQAELALAKEPASVATPLTPGQISGLRYAAQAQDAYEKSLNKITLSSAIAQGSLMQGLDQGLSLSSSLSGARYAAQAANQYNITVNAGVVGSEQTIVSAVQDALQTLNRRGDSITTAGAL